MPKTLTAVPYRDGLLKALKDPEDAARYLEASLQEEDPHMFLMALRDVADAYGRDSVNAPKTIMPVGNAQPLLARQFVTGLRPRKCRLA